MSAKTGQEGHPARKLSKKAARRPTTPEDFARELRVQKALESGRSALENYLRSGTWHFGAER